MGSEEEAKGMYVNAYLTKTEHGKTKKPDLIKWIIDQCPGVVLTADAISVKVFEQYIRVDIKVQDKQVRKKATKSLDKSFRSLIVKSAYVRKGDLFKALGIKKGTKQDESRK